MGVDNDRIEGKYQKLATVLKRMGSVVVAFSGGTDSTLLLKVCKKVLKDKVLAVTILSDTTSRYEYEDALRLAEKLNVAHLSIKSHELELTDFISNPPDKCYICKKHRFKNLISLAEEKGIPFIVDGENADDQRDFRPGSRAAKELGVRSPLKEANLSKKEIRQLSKRLGLETWNKPSAACLASRIPYHIPITSQKLKQVDDGEHFLKHLGLSGQIRVRHHGDVARLEVDFKEVVKLADEMIRNRIVKYFKSLGFKYITLDLEGYSMGSLNRSLFLEQKQP
jgi:uncharacterized protein